MLAGLCSIQNLVTHAVHWLKSLIFLAVGFLSRLSLSIGLDHHTGGVSMQKLAVIRFKLLSIQIIHKEHRYNCEYWPTTNNQSNLDVFILFKHHKNQ